MALTAKQKAFCDEYLIDLNATQAAIRAGYSEKTARSQGQRLLTHVDVQAYISKQQQKRSERTGITQDMVVAELAKLGFYDIRKAVKWGDNPERTAEGQLAYPVTMVNSADMDDKTAAAISEVSLTNGGIKIKMADKRAALDTLLKHLGGIPDDDESKSLTININSQAPVGDIRVTRSDS